MMVGGRQAAVAGAGAAAAGAEEASPSKPSSWPEAPSGVACVKPGLAGRHAIETVRVAVRSGKGRRRLGRVDQKCLVGPERARALGFRAIEHRVSGDAGTRPVVADPAHVETRTRFRGRQGGDARRGRGVVNRDQRLLGGRDSLAGIGFADLIRGDRLIAVENDVGDARDLRAGRQASLGGDHVADVSLAAAGAVLREARSRPGCSGGNCVAGSIDRNVTVNSRVA